jgi:hypothetical protein
MSNVHFFYSVVVVAKLGASVKNDDGKLGRNSFLKL